MNLEWLGHSSFRIDVQDTTFVTDPGFSAIPNAPVAVDDIDECDIILVSHAHYDHCVDVEPLAERTGATVVAVAELAAHFDSRGLDVMLRNSSPPLDVGTGVGVGLVEMDHSSSIGLGEGNPRELGPSVGFVVEGPESTLFFAGDTGICANLKVVGEVYEPDFSVVPISGGAVMDDRDASIAADWLGSSVVVPMHYDSLESLPDADPEHFAELVEETADADVAIPEPGEPIEL